MRVIQPSAFKKDIKRQKKRGKNLVKLKEVIDILVSGEVLPQRYRDHGLIGNWDGWRDCHIEPDWLLLYKLTATDLTLGRTGTHTDLF